MQQCRGICEFHKVKTTVPKIYSRFYFAVKCQVCDTWLTINGVRFSINNKMFCVCCNNIIRRRPHSKEGKSLYKKTEEILRNG